MMSSSSSKPSSSSSSSFRGIRSIASAFIGRWMIMTLLLLLLPMMMMMMMMMMIMKSGMDHPIGGHVVVDAFVIHEVTKIGNNHNNHNSNVPLHRSAQLLQHQMYHKTTHSSQGRLVDGRSCRDGHHRVHKSSMMRNMRISSVDTPRKDMKSPLTHHQQKHQQQRRRRRHFVKRRIRNYVSSIMMDKNSSIGSKLSPPSTTTTTTSFWSLLMRSPSSSSSSVSQASSSCTQTTTSPPTTMSAATSFFFLDSGRSGSDGITHITGGLSKPLVWSMIGFWIVRGMFDAINGAMISIQITTRLEELMTTMPTVATTTDGDDDNERPPNPLEVVHVVTDGGDDNDNDNNKTSDDTSNGMEQMNTTTLYDEYVNCIQSKTPFSSKLVKVLDDDIFSKSWRARRVRKKFISQGLIVVV